MKALARYAFLVGIWVTERRVVPIQSRSPWLIEEWWQRVLPWMRVRLKQRGANPKRQEILTDEPKEDYGS